MRKTQIRVEVLADSITESGSRLTTVRATYWRAIHAEIMTYRQLARCASSSRAIPVKTMLRSVLNDPAGPVHWGANQKGMQARSELQGWRQRLAESIFYLARHPALFMVWLLSLVGLHKQVANRLLEPWLWITVLISSTEWDNLLVQRHHPDAQPDFQVVAKCLLEALNGSVPILLKAGQWHLPLVDSDGPALATANGAPQSWERAKILHNLMKLSVARAARTSYTTQEGKVPNWTDDMRIYDSLISANPWHASPSEHQATPNVGQFQGARMGGNFNDDWVQNRKILERDRVKPRFGELVHYQVTDDGKVRPIPRTGF